MERRNRSILICSALVLLCACSSKEDIEFKQDRKIPVDSEINSCTLIESVNGKKITKFDWDGDRIIVEGDAIICPILDTSEIGNKTLIFSYKDEEYPLEVDIIDDKKPVMKYKSNEIILNTDDNENDLLQKLAISDEHSGIEKLLVEGEINYDKAGKYSIMIHAEDKSGNVLKKEIMVTIQEEEKTERHEESKQNKSSETNENQQKHSQQQSEAVPPQSQNSGQDHATAITAENRMFLFSEGYDYDSCYQASLSYAKAMVAQGKANGYTCTPIKDGKEYIGYQVIFK